MKVLEISFYVLNFVNIIYEKTFKKSFIKVDIFDCELLWLKNIQYSDTLYDSRFDQWKKFVKFIHRYSNLTSTRVRKVRFQIFQKILCSPGDRRAKYLMDPPVSLAFKL